jgi:hypothetical protein
MSISNSNFDHVSYLLLPKLIVLFLARRRKKEEEEEEEMSTIACVCIYILYICTHIMDGKNE